MRCVPDWQCDQVSGGCHFLAMVSVINHDHSLGVLPEHQGVTALFVSVRAACQSAVSKRSWVREPIWFHQAE
ncbi:MAG: hypothetical protein GY904_23430 [Planctomycetaceae bacterium]|nr:hypothetical protein [Planctomycetaceae bacterium]